MNTSKEFPNINMNFIEKFLASFAWLVGGIEDLRRFKIAAFQPYRELDAGDNQSLKFKWRDRESNPGPKPRA